jgi:hypothetical protein
MDCFVLQLYIRLVTSGLKAAMTEVSWNAITITMYIHIIGCLSNIRVRRLRPGVGSLFSVDHDRRRKIPTELDVISKDPSKCIVIAHLL